MRLASYLGSDGSARSAVVVNRNGADEVIDLHDASKHTLPSDLQLLLEGGDASLDLAREIAGGSAAGKPIGSVELLAPRSDQARSSASPATSRRTSRRAAASASTRTSSRPSSSSSRHPRSSGPARRSPCRRSPRDQRTGSWSSASVLGKRGRDIPIEHALDHVVGYTVFNDISGAVDGLGRRRTKPSGWDGFFDWLNGKWSDGFAAFGPVDHDDRLRDRPTPTTCR